MKKIAFATCAQVPNLYDDDLSAIPALESRGFTITPAIWDDESLDWHQFDAIVIRSTWYYWLQYERFTQWIEKLKSLNIPIWNSPEVLLWNSNKLYLKEFEANGIPIVPTAWLEKSSAQNLEEIMREKSWSEAVIKPVVSGGAYRTHRVPLAQAATQEVQTQLQEIWSAGPAMVQPFLPEILSAGEYSFLFYGGEFSHAVIKKGPDSEFRVQRIYGGTVKPISVDNAAIAAAKSVVEKSGRNLLYARVDMVKVQDQFLLVELEATEPNLFFLHDINASSRFADALVNFMKCAQ